MFSNDHPVVITNDDAFYSYVADSSLFEPLRNDIEFILSTLPDELEEDEQ